MNRIHVSLAAALFAAMSSIASGDIIYAATSTNLVRFDSASPGVVTVVGPHGLGGARTLAYNPNDNYLSTIRTLTGSMQALMRINPATGAGSFVANIGTQGGVGYIEALEWVGSRNSLVISVGATPGTTTLRDLSTAGAISMIVTNGRDNDYAVWDSTRDLLYVSDPNGVAQFVLTNLTTGANQNLGAVSLGDPAYSAASDCVYGPIWGTNNLVRINTTNGLGPITVTNLGTVGGDPIGGLAIIPAPGTLAIWSVLAVTGRRRRIPATT